ncbi:MAG: DUF4115 domain-containing protein [Woeseiaceae bacterium]|nr:DUF4115 domain-containing protein [Woeseiaceae bacterium]
MSDEQDSQSEEGAGPRCGERLAAAREELQISLVEIAKELHLDEQKVQALEANDFAPLGAPVFAKGHLKKYAQLVKVDIDDILMDYHQLTRSEGLPPVVSDRKAPKVAASPTPWIAAGVVVLIVAAIAAWFFLLRPASDDVESEPPAQAEPAIVDESAAANVPTATRLDDGADAIEPRSQAAEPEREATEPVAEPAAAVTAAAETAAPSDAAASVEPGQLALDLNFIGDCWTEITDGNGRRLFFDLGRAGRTVSVAGAAPLSVLLGNADNVRLELNGIDYLISDADRRGETARFTLSAP